MSDSPIFDKMYAPAPIFDNVNNKFPKPKKWYEHVLTPVFRRWMYGVAVAAVTAWASLTNNLEVLPVILPLIIAIFYVDKGGEPR